MDEQEELIVVVYRAGSEVLLRELPSFEGAQPMKAPEALALLLPADGPQIAVLRLGPTADQHVESAGT